MDGPNERFHPVETLFARNGSEQTLPFEVTVTRTHTFTVTNAFELSSSVQQKFSESTTVTVGAKYNRSTVETLTTSTGVKYTLYIPGQGKAEVDYGAYVAHPRIVMRVYHNNRWCTPQQTTGAEEVAVPINSQGFENPRQWPAVNRGGIVNGVTGGSADIYPGTTIAIYGQYYVPADRVNISYSAGGATLSGGAWWWDSETQINVTLPADAPPGLARLTITTSEGRTSNQRSFTISERPPTEPAPDPEPPPNSYTYRGDANLDQYCAARGYDGATMDGGT